MAEYIKPTGGPLVLCARAYALHPDTDEIAYYWVAWDAAGRKVHTKPRGTWHDLIGRVYSYWGTPSAVSGNGGEPFMVRLSGVYGPEALVAVRRMTLGQTSSAGA